MKPAMEIETFCARTTANSIDDKHTVQQLGNKQQPTDTWQPTLHEPLERIKPHPHYVSDVITVVELSPRLQLAAAQTVQRLIRDRRQGQFVLAFALWRDGVVLEDLVIRTRNSRSE